MSSLGTHRSGARLGHHCHRGRTWGALAITPPVKPSWLSWRRLLTVAGNGSAESSFQLVTPSTEAPHPIVHQITPSLRRERRLESELQPIC